MEKFKNLKQGETFKDYSDDDWKIEKTGSIADWNDLQEYDASGSMEHLIENPEDCNYTDEEVKDIKLVAASHPTYGKAVFDYNDLKYITK